MTHEMHEANRRRWDKVAPYYQSKPDLEERRRRVIHEPGLALGEAERRYLSQVAGQRIAVLGSGDQLVVFALAGLGARVTSVDISQTQLDLGAARANACGLAGITFLRADVTDLSALADGEFDVVYTGGHVAVWVSDLRRFYSEASRILKPGGLLIVNEYHPFRKPWADIADHLEIGYPYYQRGPYLWDSSEDVPNAEKGSLITYEFHWTVSDYVNALLAAGCELAAMEEWGDGSQNWELAPVGGLPEWLLIVSRKRG